MIYRDKTGKVTGFKVQYHGKDVYISRDMLTGKSKGLSPAEAAKVLHKAELDSEHQEAVKEMWQSIVNGDK